MAEAGDVSVREQLLKNVKKEVKQIMEEAVTKKFVHEESCSVTSLCGAVETCLLHGLRKRALGLFKNSTTSALLAKVSKSYEPAAKVQRLLKEYEKNEENNRKSVTTGSSNQSPTMSKRLSSNSRYLWIRLALFEKLLAKIVDYLINNAQKYYDKDALIADSVDGLILASLLVGPCSLEYSKMKTPDHYWTDPPADELVQRHRIHSSTANHCVFTNGGGSAHSPKRPSLQVRKNISSTSCAESDSHSHSSAKDYVKSLHQNLRSTLLYGKNNVVVQPDGHSETLPGYLSLHQDVDRLSIKWTPNQLMNGGCNEEEIPAIDSGVYWDYAITIYLDEIVYIHCHQQPNSGGTLVLVGQDGVQHAPLHFPKGGHLLAFLSCLETGLLPHGQLDPPLWAQKGKGKVFPKLKRKMSSVVLSSGGAGSTSPGVTGPPGAVTGGGHGPFLSSVSSNQSSQSSVLSSVDGGLGQTIIEEEEAADYVFRIITSFAEQDFPEEVQALDFSSVEAPPLPFDWSAEDEDQCGLNELRAIESCARTLECTSPSTRIVQQTVVKELCDSMQRQILSRAFYGWLSHCRHLKTVRTHLSGLVNPLSITEDRDPIRDCAGLQAARWREMCGESGEVICEMEIYRLIYYGGCDHSIRPEVWPYLLGYYKFGSTTEDRVAHDQALRRQYETTVSEWLIVEAIVRQQDAEAIEANQLKMQELEAAKASNKLSSLAHKDSTLSNDVFETIDVVVPPTVTEETSTSPAPLATSSGHLVSAAHQFKGQGHRAVTSVASSGSDCGRGMSSDEGRGESLEPSLSGGESVGGQSVTCESPQKDSPSRPSPAAGRGGSNKMEDVTERVSQDVTTAHTHGGLSRTDNMTLGENDDSNDSGTSRPIYISKPTVDMTSSNTAILDPCGDEEKGERNGAGEGGGGLLEAGTKESVTEQTGGESSCLGAPCSPAVSIASNGGIYSASFIESISLNIHRIDKDVQRCDRTYWYFNATNLEKLRNIMCTYVWENIDIGYIQGMCDLVAPLLVVLDDEAKTYGCFCQLMKRMMSNFPHGGSMDQHFGNMRSLIQILDPELFEHMHQNGDYTHFYFCYRWFLLDFKRELLYNDVFNVWELIWAAKNLSSAHFVLFIALALVEYYRDIIIDNNMDFTDIIKFFNEMAERHDVKKVMQIARDLVAKLQELIQNK